MEEEEECGSGGGVCVLTASCWEGLCTGGALPTACGGSTSECGGAVQLLCKFPPHSPETQMSELAGLKRWTRVGEGFFLRLSTQEWGRGKRRLPPPSPACRPDHFPLKPALARLLLGQLVSALLLPTMGK